MVKQLIESESVIPTGGSKGTDASYVACQRQQVLVVLHCIAVLRIDHLEFFRDAVFFKNTLRALGIDPVYVNRKDRCQGRYKGYTDGHQAPAQFPVLVQHQNRQKPHHRDAHEEQKTPWVVNCPDILHILPLDHFFQP